ncbi:MAG: hypothetical protein CR997_00555 [Acidobacteria bacterium]|nr:MAG: hypothetical protein CR997_00555 [Acidobacteriota bacterium]
MATMALDFLFKNSKEEEKPKIIDQALSARNPVFLTSTNYKHSGFILDVENRQIYLSHDLSRDEIFRYFKGRKLKIQISSNNSLYEGQTRLAGLGMKRNQHALKLEWPKSLRKNDPRQSFRLSTIGLSTSVSFSCDESNIFTGRLIDISMKGAGIRPDVKYNINDIKLSNDIPIHTDIRLENNWSISTVSSVRNFNDVKIGIEFGELDKKTKKNLFKYIQAKRKEEQYKVPDIKQQFKSEAAERKDSSKPCALIFGQNEWQIEILERALKRRFEVLIFPLKVSDIRTRIELEKPDVCFLEIGMNSKEIYRRMKKTISVFSHKTPFMLYTENLSQEHLNLYFSGMQDAIIDLKDAQALMTYKKIENYLKSLQ